VGTTATIAERQTLKVHSGAGDRYTRDGVALGRRDLAQRFQGAVHQANLPLVLDVRISPDAEYETVAQGLTAARNAGIANINFVDR